MTVKFIKTTSKGQITIPKKWRSKFKSSNFVMEVHQSQVVIKPVLVKDLNGEEIVFDASRDNDGKGISPQQLIKKIKKVQNR